MQIQLSITVASNAKSPKPAATSDDGELSQSKPTFDSGDNFDNSQILSIIHNMDRLPRYKAATNPNNNAKVAEEANISAYEKVFSDACSKNSYFVYMQNVIHIKMNSVFVMMLLM